MLLIGGSGLVKGRVRLAGPVMREICDELEPALIASSFTEKAPFRTVSLILRFGEQTLLDPVYEPVDRRHSELPVAVELPMSELRTAKRDDLKQRFFDATLRVLADVARKYNLPFEDFEKQRR